VDIDLTQDQTVAVEASARFIENTHPLTRVRERAYDDASYAATYRRRAGELGWFAMLVPEDLGGGTVSGNGVMDASLIAYERGGMLQPGSFVGTNVAAYAVAINGSDEQREKVLPKLVAGEESASWLASAPTGSQAEKQIPGAGLSAERTKSGYVLHGPTNFIEGPDAPAWLLVTATTAEGPIQFLVEPGTPGFKVAPVDGLDISRRFSEVVCDGAEVSDRSVIGAPGEISDLLDRQLGIACVLTVAESVGAMNRIFDLTVHYAQDRIAFGRPIGSFQAVKHQLADTSLLLEMSKALVTAAAQAVGSWDGYGPQAASMAKAFVGDCGVDLAQNCFQVFGGIGYTWEHDQHLYLRRISTDSLLYGQPSWHRERLCELSGL
jgi:alkylation response protein AidB-like acyl-CoA dehydrogenase